MKMNGDCGEFLKKMSMRCILAVESFANHKTIYNFAPHYPKETNKLIFKIIMIIVPVKEGENIEKALKKFKRKFEKTGVVKELRNRQAFEKPSVTNRKKMMRAIYIQKLQQNEE